MALTYCCSELKCRSQGLDCISVFAFYTTSGVNDWKNIKSVDFWNVVLRQIQQCIFNSELYSNHPILALYLIAIRRYIFHSLRTWRKRPIKKNTLPITLQFLYSTCCISSIELDRLRSSDNHKHHGLNCLKLSYAVPLPTLLWVMISARCIQTHSFLPVSPR